MPVSSGSQIGSSGLQAGPSKTGGSGNGLGGGSPHTERSLSVCAESGFLVR
jgi:hypothetical protein